MHKDGLIPMDTSGIRSVLEQKRGGPLSADDEELLQSLTVKELLRIWQSVSNEDDWEAEWRDLGSQRQNRRASEDSAVSEPPSGATPAKTESGVTVPEEEEEEDNDDDAEEDPVVHSPVTIPPVVPEASSLLTPPSPPTPTMEPAVHENPLPTVATPTASARKPALPPADEPSWRPDFRNWPKPESLIIPVILTPFVALPMAVHTASPLWARRSR